MEIKPEMVGLKSWKDFQSERESDIPWPRRSGRTTKMLLEAVGLAADGKTVCIIAHDRKYERELTDMAREYAVIAGANPNNIIHNKFYRNRMDISFLSCGEEYIHSVIDGEKVYKLEDHFILDLAIERITGR